LFFQVIFDRWFDAFDASEKTSVVEFLYHREKKKTENETEEVERQKQRKDVDFFLSAAVKLNRPRQKIASIFASKANDCCVRTKRNIWPSLKRQKKRK